MLEHLPRPSRSSRLVPVLVLLAMAFAGCARLSAAHLQLRPLEGRADQAFTAKFMRFEYRATPQDGAYVVKGTAWPVRENLPAWADSVDSLCITAYLCDGRGNVLATEAANYQAQKIPAGGFSFAFLIKHARQPSGGYFVTFGYGGMFTASNPPSTQSAGSGPASGNHVFFASEQAVLKK